MLERRALEYNAEVELTREQLDLWSDTSNSTASASLVVVHLELAW